MLLVWLLGLVIVGCGLICCVVRVGWFRVVLVIVLVGIRCLGVVLVFRNCCLIFIGFR